jgi:hypothetical protein
MRSDPRRPKRRRAASGPTRPKAGGRVREAVSGIAARFRRPTSGAGAPTPPIPNRLRSPLRLTSPSRPRPLKPIRCGMRGVLTPRFLTIKAGRARSARAARGPPDPSGRQSPPRRGAPRAAMLAARSPLTKATNLRPQSRARFRARAACGSRPPTAKAPSASPQRSGPHRRNGDGRAAPHNATLCDVGVERESALKHNEALCFPGADGRRDSRSRSCGSPPPDAAPRGRKSALPARAPLSTARPLRAARAHGHYGAPRAPRPAGGPDCGEKRRVRCQRLTPCGLRRRASLSPQRARGERVTDISAQTSSSFAPQFTTRKLPFRGVVRYKNDIRLT